MNNLRILGRSNIKSLKNALISLNLDLFINLNQVSWLRVGLSWTYAEAGVGKLQEV